MANAKDASFHERKKKSTPQVDGIPRSKSTGMGPKTQRHFINVQQRMFNFLAQQEAWEYGDIDQQPHVAVPSSSLFARSSRHHHQHHHHVDPIFVDREKASKPEPKISTPAPSRKKSAHNGSSKKDSAHR
ncbi:unnamed protein product [Rotaria sp. Silwood1]|nr:unnamed protein product [Rotaria sp. Silwood1]CAF1109661.1 unnamed protein product [Rotaria sp. Silwood1]CAF3398778.1 unnamed protein product [Rotaria sp. Silwood1]CAF3418837.1 unnamed protein product [Rotaria sp. Silwood1]CAF3434921.1 unnamed protein product [Rotaria sp. Silwood1]